MIEANKTIKSSVNKRNPLQSITNFFGDVKQEFKKITWTSKKELFKNTKIVLAAIFSVSFIVYFVDIAIQKTLQFLTLLTHWI